MRYLAYCFCAVVFGCVASLAHGGELWDLGNASSWDLGEACSCTSGGECLCTPASCNCNGCTKHAETVAEESDLPQIPRFTAPVQYQQQCVNGKCSLVPVTQPMPAVSAALAMYGSCATGNCGQVQSYGGGAGSCSSGNGRSFQPVRRVFGVFRGRGCRGCGG